MVTFYSSWPDTDRHHISNVNGPLSCLSCGYFQTLYLLNIDEKYNMTYIFLQHFLTVQIFNTESSVGIFEKANVL